MKYRYSECSIQLPGVIAIQLHYHRKDNMLYVADYPGHLFPARTTPQEIQKMVNGWVKDIEETIEDELERKK